MSCADKPRPDVLCGQAYFQIKECLDGRSFLVAVIIDLGRCGLVAVLVAFCVALWLVCLNGVVGWLLLFAVGRPLWVSCVGRWLWVGCYGSIVWVGRCEPVGVGRSLWVNRCGSVTVGWWLCVDRFVSDAWVD